MNILNKYKFIYRLFYFDKLYRLKTTNFKSKKIENIKVIISIFYNFYYYTLELQ